MRPPVTIPLDEMIIAGNGVALIFFDSSEVEANEARPPQGRAVLLNQPAGLGTVFLRVFQENFNRLDGHGTVAIDGNTRKLSRFHQYFQHEEKLLRALDSKRGHNHAASALHRLADDFG